MDADIRKNLVELCESARWRMAHEIYADEMTNDDDREFHLKAAERDERRFYELWDSLETKISALETQGDGK